jgi:hypothetical protein
MTVEACPEGSTVNSLDQTLCSCDLGFGIPETMESVDSEVRAV